MNTTRILNCLGICCKAKLFYITVVFVYDTFNLQLPQVLLRAYLLLLKGIFPQTTGKTSCPKALHHEVVFIPDVLKGE